MIIHRFSSNGKMVLFDQTDASDGIKQMTKRMELTADGDHIVMTLTVNNGDSPDTAKREVRMSAEDLFSLIETYVEIAY